MAYLDIKAFRKRRREFLKEYLGNRCVQCGCTDWLEFDHIDPTTKAFSIANHLHLNLKDLLVEVDKCQLLCHPHHIAKSIKDALGKPSWNSGTALHGAHHMAYTLRCKCEKCLLYRQNRNIARRITKT